MRSSTLIKIALIACLISCKKKEDIEPTVSSISIEREPTKTEYFEYDSLDLTGLIIKLNMDNGESELVHFENFSSNSLMCVPNNGAELFLTYTEVEIIYLKTIQIVSLPITVVRPTVTDYDGNIYAEIRIGNQIWMSENLKVTHHPDGTPIPTVSDTNNNRSDNDEWEALSNTDEAYCYYENNADSSYGILYTWAAAMGGETAGSNSNPSNIQGICPDGWHIPSFEEWAELGNFVNNDYQGYNEPRATLKSTSGWKNNGNGTDTYGFSAFPSGLRSSNGFFNNLGLKATWWSTTESYIGGVETFYLTYNSSSLHLVDGFGDRKSSGLCVRCVKD